MPGPQPQSLYLLTDPGVPFLVDATLGRDETWLLTFQRAVDRKTEDFSAGGWVLSYAISVRVGDASPAKTGTLSLSDADSGEATLPQAAADFSALTWDLGETLKVLWLEVRVSKDGAVRACMDGTGKTHFPYRLHRNTA